MRQHFREYTYKTYDTQDAYGQPALSDTSAKIHMAVSLLNTQLTDNILYKDAQYLGITTEPIDDKCVVLYGEETLKVLYVVKGRYNQVYMARQK